MIAVDGAHGEGGGQIVRTACSLAALTGQPCRIFNIRLGRREPGLKLQHLAAVRALAELSAGSLDGDRVGSTELVFRPARILGRDLTVKLDTAGSVTLVLQSLLPAILAASAPVIVNFVGGATDTADAPTFDYFRHVLLWFLQRMGVDISVDLRRRGYYPRGGAELAVEVTPTRLKPLQATERGTLRRIVVISSASNILRLRHVAERQIEGALSVLAAALPAPERVLDYLPSFSPGTAVCIVAEFEHTVIAADGLGAPRKRAEEVGHEAALAFIREFESAGCVDRHMADQILPYMALAGPPSCVMVPELTAHCRTNMWVIEKFLDGRFEVNDGLLGWTAP